MEAANPRAAAAVGDNGGVTDAHPSFRDRVRAEARLVGESLLSFGPSAGRRWPLALQAGLAMAVPVVLLAVLGHSDIALFAATGAFTVIYGARPSGRASRRSSRRACSRAPRSACSPRRAVSASSSPGSSC